MNTKGSAADTRHMIATGAVLSALLLVGCTIPAVPTSNTPSGSTSRGTSAPSPGRSPQLLPTAVPNDPLARRNVELRTCERTGNGWQAIGVARNPSKEPTTVTITIFFTNKHATVLDAAQVTITVQPGESQAWTAESAFKAPAGTLCVLRGAGPRD